MTTSRDPDSRRAAGARRRDFRSARDLPDTPRLNPARTTVKDTRRWCRGVPGREHIAAKVPFAYRTVTLTHRDEETGETTTVHDQVPTYFHVRCSGCGTKRLPDHVRATVDPELAARLELAARWCGEGHLVDVVETPRSGGRVWRSRACLMCGTPA